MSYIAFLDMVGTKTYASIGTDDYINALTRFHKEIDNTIKSIESVNVYVYSDNAYVQTQTLEDMIYFLQTLRQSLMKQHLYFTSAVGIGRLGEKTERFEKKKGYSSVFTSPETIDVYVEQSKFSGIGNSLSVEIIRELKKNEKLKEKFCSSLYVTKDKRSYISIHDISYNYVSQESLQYIISDYLITAITNRRAGRYYITPIISMIMSYKPWSFINEIEEITRIVMMQKIKNELAAENIDEYSILFFYALVNRLFSVYDENSFEEDIDVFFRKLFEASNLGKKVIIENLENTPVCIISNKYKRKLIQKLVVIE